MNQACLSVAMEMPTQTRVKSKGKTELGSNDPLRVEDAPALGSVFNYYRGLNNLQ